MKQDRVKSRNSVCVYETTSVSCERPRETLRGTREGKVELMYVSRSLNKYSTSPVISRSVLIVFNFLGSLTTKSCQPLVRAKCTPICVLSPPRREYPRAQSYDQEIYYVVSPRVVYTRCPGSRKQQKTGYFDRENRKYSWSTSHARKSDHHSSEIFFSKHRISEFEKDLEHFFSLFIHEYRQTMVCNGKL